MSWFDFQIFDDITGGSQQKVDCPECKTSQYVIMNDPNGQEIYTCCECNKRFYMDWREF
jgi:transposase-like protein